MKKYSHIYIFATGLLGGSVGLGLKSRGFSGEIIGIGRNEKHLSEALARGAIDRMFTDIAEAVKVSGNDGPVLAVACSPVGSISENVISIAEHAESPFLITDLGSTKSEIVGKLRNLPNGCRFVGSHPIAGSEKSGVEFAEADLFAGKTTIITPGIGDAESDIAEIELFWTALGSSVVRMSPERHDRILARISHLPHLLSSLLMNMADEDSRACLGSGFRDMTRLAAGNTQMWLEIVKANRAEIEGSIREFTDALENLREAVIREDEEAILTTLEAARVKTERFYK